jgi:hypothetical protein
MKTIKITVSPQGDTKVAVEGACGSECEGLVAPIHAALGRATSMERTPDYNRRSESVAQTQTVAR